LGSSAVVGKFSSGVAPASEETIPGVEVDSSTFSSEREETAYTTLPKN